MPLAADRRYSGVHGLVVAYYVIMNTGTAVVGDVLLDDATVPTDIERSCSKGL